MSSINDLPEEQRPREKLASNGAGALSDAELLAIFLRVGVKGESAIQIGQRLIETYGNLAQLGRLDIAQLSAEHGIGLAKAAQLAAAFEIGARVARESTISKPLDSPERIYELMAPQLLHHPTESLHVLLVDSRLNFTRSVLISKGSISQTTCLPRDIVRPAIVNQSHGFIMVHNHPSGDPTPSRSDLSMTQRVAESAELLQIRMLDHVIIGQSVDGKKPYYSFRENGKI